MIRRTLLSISLVTIILFTVGCKLDPAKARDSIALAYGFIGDIQTKHLAECQANPQTPTCQLINKGVAVQRLAAVALNTYCAGPPAAGAQDYANGGPCSVQAGLESRLVAALTDLNNVMNDIKKLGGK